MSSLGGALIVGIANERFWADKGLALKQEMIFASTGKKLDWQAEDYYIGELSGSDIQTNPPATNAASKVGWTALLSDRLTAGPPVWDQVYWSGSRLGSWEPLPSSCTIVTGPVQLTICFGPASQIGRLPIDVP